jgi:uncharacterized protein YjdB
MLAPKAVTRLDMKEQPTDKPLNTYMYTHGDRLDLTGMEITITYDYGPQGTIQGPWDDVAFSIDGKTITDGAMLSRDVHNGHTLVATYKAMRVDVGVLKLAKAEGMKVSSPYDANHTHDRVSFNGIAIMSDEENGQVTEYTKNTTNAVPAYGWQESPVFDNLSPNKEYWFFARAKANENYMAGEPSEGVMIKTDRVPVVNDPGEDSAYYSPSGIYLPLLGKLFAIGAGAGLRTYTIEEEGTTGEGSISGSVLNVTSCGAFSIGLSTDVNGDHAAGEKTIATLVVEKRDIGDTFIMAMPSTLEYSGNKLTPDAMVQLDSGVLTEGTDYELSYENNVEIGTATIKATGKGNYTGTVSASFTITHKRQVDKVVIEGAPEVYKYKASGKKYNVIHLKTSVTPASTKTTRFVWSSSDVSIAEVSQDGAVRFNGKEGTVSITVMASDGGGKSSSVKIRVVSNVTGIRTPAKTIYIQRGKSMSLPPIALDDATAPQKNIKSKLTWKSSDPGVLSVIQRDSNVKELKASKKVNEGLKASKNVNKRTTVNVLVSAANGKSLKIKVVVLPNAVKLKSVKAEFPKKMKTGKSYQLKTKLNSAKATGVKVTYKSSNKKVLSVDAAGKLRAHRKGTAKITIKAGSKKFVKKVNVVWSSRSKAKAEAVKK